MERRRELRVKADEPVRVIVLGGWRDQMDAKIVDLSGKGMRIMAPKPLRAGDALRIEFEDGILLGEVCHCRAEDSSYAIGIDIDQVLVGLTAMARFNKKLLGVREPANERSQTHGALSYSMSE